MFHGSSSAMPLIGWSAIRVSTSRRYASGSCPLSFAEPTQLLLARKSPIDGTTVDDRHTWTPIRVPAVPVPPSRAQSVGVPPALARCGHIRRNSVWAKHAGSHGTAPARTPTPSRHLRPSCAAHRRTPGTSTASVRVPEFCGGGAPAGDAVRA
jgi:hypothetical protein